MQTAIATYQADTTAGKKEMVLEVTELCKSFGENLVLDHFNLRLLGGENVVVLGRSGSGKSVLIKCIIGLMAADSGHIEVFGQDIAALNVEELDRIRMRIGFLFQSNALYDSMTVRENLEFPLRRHGLELTQEEVDKMVMEALENVGLDKAVDMMPAELSGGMRKRIALARTLILKPEIIMYDEPTTGLDPVTGHEISQLIVDIQKKYKASSLIISHDMRCIKLTADRIIVLINGSCYANGSFNDLKASTDPLIQQFFNHDE